jgi:DNA helicase HerA-like ATPase
MSDIYVGLGTNNERQLLHLARANRHGLVAGATGTGKTVTLQTIAEQFNPDLDVETVITELKVGEALVSMLQDDGSPTVVLRTLVAPPCSRLGPVTDR